MTLDSYDVGATVSFTGSPLRPPSEFEEHFRFEELPPELRHRVFILMPHTGFGVSENITIIGGLTPPRHPAITAICRRLRHEALAAYFSTTHFCFWNSNRFSHQLFRWLGAQEDFAIFHIKTFEFYTSTTHNTSSHVDKITVHVRDLQVSMDGSECQLCSHVANMAQAAAKFTELLKGLPLVDGVRRMTKAVLSEMMTLALSEEIEHVFHPFGCMDRRRFLERVHWIWEHEGDYLEHSTHGYVYGHKMIRHMPIR